MAKPVRSAIPASFKATAEEEKFFEDARKADIEEQVEEQEEETEAEPEAEEATPDEPAEEIEGEQTEAESETAEETQPSEEEVKGRQVPIGELYAEREKRKQLQTKIEQLEGTFARVMERLNGQQQPAPQPQPGPEIPAYDADPVAHLKAKIDLLEGGVTSYGQQQAQRNAMEQFQQALGYLEGQYRQQANDYDAAIEFAKNQRDAELAVLGYNDEARANILRQEIIGVSASAMQRGQNPAEVFYQYAKVKGWGKQNPAPAPAPTPAPKPAPAAKLATIAKAQKASHSLPKGGSAPRATVTLTDLAAMDDAEFDKNFDRVMRKS